MKGIVVKQSGGDVPELIWEDVADVSYGVDEVLVTVRASAVNRADLMQAQGAYPPPAGASEILGLEMAGVITAVGSDVRDWAVGDCVCALLPGGGYAEQVAVPAGMLLPLPNDWSFEMGAAVPEVWYTAFVNLFLEGELQAGERVLIHAGASGVGTAAIQLAKLAGATVIITAGADHKTARCLELGADVAINYKEQDFLAEVLAATNDQGVHLILDPVGASYLEKNMRALTPLGRLVHIGLLGGAQTEMNLGLLLIKRLRLIGSTLRARPVDEKIRITEQFKKRFWPALLDGTLSPIVDTTFPLKEAQKAHDYVRQNRNTGKVILTLPNS